MRRGRDHQHEQREERLEERVAAGKHEDGHERELPRQHGDLPPRRVLLVPEEDEAVHRAKVRVVEPVLVAHGDPVYKCGYRDNIYEQKYNNYNKQTR